MTNLVDADTGEVIAASNIPVKFGYTNKTLVTADPQEEYGARCHPKRWRKVLRVVPLMIREDRHHRMTHHAVGFSMPRDNQPPNRTACHHLASQVVPVRETEDRRTARRTFRHLFGWQRAPYSSWGSAVTSVLLV